MAVKPLNRLQAFLAKIAGESAPDLTPHNVTEYYLDKIADAGSGGGGGGVLVTVDTNGTLDKTFSEIYSAVQNGMPVFIKYTTPSNTDMLPVTSVVTLNRGIYAISLGGSSGSEFVPAIYIANTDDGYPTYQEVS